MQSSKSNQQWFESQSFWTHYAPVLFDEERWSEAPFVAQRVVDLAHLKPGDLLLDAGCGPGRIAVELAALGIQVTGVDMITSFLEAGEESAQSEGVDIQWVQDDLRRFVRPQSFNAAVSLYTSFGYCQDIEEDRQILENIARSLKPNGFFILECVSRETALLHFTEGEEFQRGGFEVSTHFELLKDNRGLLSQWNIQNQQECHSHSFVQRLYSAEELKEILFSLGYKTVDFFGGWDARPYDEKADTMVLVAQMGSLMRNSEVL